MRVEQLRYVVEIAKTKSINQAAANLYLSQPNLSKAVKALEEELGCVLIQRTNRGIQLTKKGQDFVTYATSIINQFNHLQTLGSSEYEKSMPCLAVGSAGISSVSFYCSEMLNEHKDNPFRLVLHEGPRDEVIRSVSSGESEIGFALLLDCYKHEIIKRMQNEGLKFIHIANDRLIVKVGPKNPLHSANCEATREMLRQYPMVTFDELDLYHYADRARLFGITTDKYRIIVHTRDSMNSILHYTDAFALICSHKSKSENDIHYDNDLRRLYIKDCDATMDYGMICREHEELSPLARELFDRIVSDSL